MLDALLGDLRDQDYPGEAEIVVVEETSDPRPPEGVRYIPLPVQNRGIAYARNQAIAHASHELIVFVDDDCRVGPDWLRCLLAPMDDTEVLGVQGGVTVPDGTGAIGWAESLLGFPGGGITRVHQARGHSQPTIEVSTLNAAYRRPAVLQAGGFPESARLGGEDDLLAKRVAGHGRLLFVPEAMVRHAARGSFGAIWRWFVRRGRAEAGLLQSGMAPAGYAGRLLRASLLLKLALVMLLIPWLCLWPLVLLLAALPAATWWRLRWALHDAEVPRTGFWVAPLVRLTMDLAADTGRLSAWLAPR